MKLMTTTMMMSMLPPRCSQVYVLIHNIDGSSLRSFSSQETLALLAHVPGVHMIASVDHLHASLTWDPRLLALFRWLWTDCTTFAPYPIERGLTHFGLFPHSGFATTSLLSSVQTVG